MRLQGALSIRCEGVVERGGVLGVKADLYSGNRAIFGGTRGLNDFKAGAFFSRFRKVEGFEVGR